MNLPDGARGSVRMGVVAASALVQQEVGIEALAHYTCRDRNLLGMTGDLLGAQALGVRNLLLVTGDPPKTGPYPDATAVFDVDSIGLTNLVRRLNHGQDVGGTSLGSRTEFVIGVGVNPGAENREREMRRWYWKVDAGAEYAVTQPVFDPASLADFLDEVERRGTRIPVVASVWPLTDLRGAEFLNNEVPGIRVPERVLGRMRRAEGEGEEHARAEGRAVAREVLAEARELTEGVQVIAPGGDVEHALRVLEG
ncbi:MAG: methylenetetrahydrofolate reductase [Gemmatimonadota bacterium]